MQTDPISAASGYRIALERIIKAQTFHETLRLASKALEITFKKPEAERIEVSSGFGYTTQQPYITVAMSAPAVQLNTTQAREIALQILEAAESAEQDGFIISFATDRLSVPIEQAGGLLQEFRDWREQQRQRGEGVEP